LGVLAPQLTARPPAANIQRDPKLWECHRVLVKPVAAARTQVDAVDGAPDRLAVGEQRVTVRGLRSSDTAKVARKDVFE
jgi:hypothetical protein